MLSGSYDRTDMFTLATAGLGDIQPMDKAAPLQGWTLQAIGYASLNDYLTLHLNIGRKDRIPSEFDHYSQVGAM